MDSIQSLYDLNAVRIDVIEKKWRHTLDGSNELAIAVHSRRNASQTAIILLTRSDEPLASRNLAAKRLAFSSIRVIVNRERSLASKGRDRGVLDVRVRLSVANHH